MRRAYALAHSSEGGFAWRPVVTVAAAHFALLMAVAGRYGYHRDELYFLEASHHMAWGFVDQPPLTPALVWLERTAFGHSLVGIRLAPALATTAAVVLAGLLARELGGRRRSQTIAAAAVAVGFSLGVGHLMVTAAFDFALWFALLVIAASLLRTGDPRRWVLFGAVSGIAMLNKHLVVILVLALLAGLVIERRWRLLFTPWLVTGGALALLIALPNLLWQADHGWPQLDMAEAIADRIGGENRALLLPSQLLFVGLFLVPLLVAGTRWLFRDPTVRRFRPLLWAWPVAMVIVFVTGGRPYYPVPFTIAVMIAGAVAREGWRPVGWRRDAGLVGISLLSGVAIALPILPVGWLEDFPLAAANDTLSEQVGWPGVVDQLATAVANLPPADRERAIILTGSYGEAGAVDRYGPERGLPEVYSPHNAYGFWRQPTDDGAVAVTIRFHRRGLLEWFDDCTEVDRVDIGYDLDSEVNGVPIAICRGLRGTWAEVWPQMRFLS
jgi:4-amino-4-deoxy-L-arabinose transferase-like glycosyltransferase